MSRHLITVSHTISMGHRLPSYDGICASPHGHNVKVEASFESTTFLDFKKVQEELRDLLHDFDHAMVLHRKDPLVEVLTDMMFRVVVLSEEPSTEVIAQYLFDQLYAREYRPACVTVYETEKYSAAVDVFSGMIWRDR